MNLLKLKNIIYASLFFALICMCSYVKADTFENIESRIDQNNKMITEANNMSSVYRSSYLDLSLKELEESNYTALTTIQQNKLKDLANNTILEGNPNSFSNTEKLEKFYDWILDNYYYYETPNRIIGLSFDKRYDNPYYLLIYEYDIYGKVRARANGYTATLIALARTQNIPARLVGGYYNKNARDNYNDWEFNVDDKSINHVWVEAYVNNYWRMFDPTADSYKEYNDITGEYIDNLENEITEKENIDDIQDNDTEDEDKNENENELNESDEYQNKYFDPNIEELSKTHIAFKTYAGSNNIKYISKSSERSALKDFMNIKENGKSNGKKINSSYDSSNSATWFSKSDINSITNGYGRVKKIYWPEKRLIYGSLNLKSFTALENISVPNNKIKSVNITDATSLRKVNVSNNNITKLVVKGSKNINSIKAANNPITYIEYNFAPTKQKAIIKAGKGGTISVNYAKTNNKRKHYLKAKPNSDYNFLGWYKGSKRISKKSNFTLVKNSSFTYVAKFKKKPPAPYIKVSISKQKLWYYKYGKVQYTSPIVTGQKYVHDTPTGTFKIRGKAREIYLIGPDYKSFVNYWMPIYGDIGLHDATWRWTFGGDIYTYNGSHGCINLPFKTAKYIYNNVPTGTMVKVVK